MTSTGLHAVVSSEPDLSQIGRVAMSDARCSGNGMNSNARTILATALLVATCFTACSSDGGADGTTADSSPADGSTVDDSTGDAANDEQPDAIPDPLDTEPNTWVCADIHHITDLHQRTFAGGGVQVWLQLEALNNAPISAQALIDCLEVGPVDQNLDVAWEAETAEFHSGHTLVLAVPGATDEENAAVVAAINDFAETLPIGEQVAIYRWSTEVLQVASFTDGLSSLRSRTEALFLSSEAPLAPVDDAFDAATDALRDISRDAVSSLRTIVVIAPGLELTEVPDGPGHLLNLWLIGRDSTGTLAAEPRTHVVETDSVEALSDHLAPFSSTITDHRASGTVVLGVCPSQNGMEVRIATDDSPETNVVRLEEPLPEQDTADCDPSTVLAAEYDATRRIEFIFTQEQRAIYNQRVADLDKTDFNFSIRLSPLHGPSAAVAHIRGKGSLGCQRKNYAVDLGSRPRFLLPDSATDEVLLISMCRDVGYVNQLTANRLMYDLGHFDLQFDLVELVVDGTSVGVYLLIENPANEFVSDHSRPRAVLRRDADMDNRPPDVKFSVDDDGAAFDRYHDFLDSVDEYQGDALRQHLTNNMDIVQYLKWIGLMSLLGNGDYVDEVWFTSSETISDGGPGDYYSITGWDTDDLFSDCHYDGSFAFDDPNGLLYCTESILDQAVFADPVIYAWYVDILEETIDTVTEDVFDAAVDRTVTGLLPFFEDQAVRDAMIELHRINPAATDIDEARDTIVARGEALKVSFAARRADYSQLIQNYRDSQ